MFVWLQAKRVYNQHYERFATEQSQGRRGTRECVDRRYRKYRGRKRWELWKKEMSLFSFFVRFFIDLVLKPMLNIVKTTENW